MAARHDDIEVKFSQPYPTAYVEKTIRAVPGVSSVESWVQTVAVRKLSDDTDDTTISFTLNGVPPETDMISFPVIEALAADWTIRTLLSSTMNCWRHRVSK